MKNGIIAWAGIVLAAFVASPLRAQKIDDERMVRDIEVAENVLSTLIKQQLMNSQRAFFPLEIEGSYQPGYGITFRLPADYTVPIAFSIAGGSNDVVIYNGEGPGAPPDVQYNFRLDEERQSENINRPAVAGDMRLRDRRLEQQRVDLDSIRDLYSDRVIEASRTFLLDYGDMITQLQPQERIVISNQSNERRWVGRYFNAPKQRRISVEATKGDLTQLRQGKITRDQALSRIKVVNTETVEAVEPDLELLSSIFSRLYSQDLSKTYFTDDNIYFEHLKDYGVVYYMKVYSGIERGDFTRRYLMPTLGLTDVDQETRDEKVKELYPLFEQDLKDNILEYGRTIKSINDQEVLVFQVNMTRCTGCDIPESLELSISGSTLKEFGAGKLDRKTATSRFTVKKGKNQ